MPASKRDITIKILTQRDQARIDKETKGLAKMKKDAAASTMMKYVITSINGETDNTKIRQFVDRDLLAIDARAFRNHIEEIQPSVDLSFDHEDHRGRINTINIPIGINFFWPDVTI